MLTFGFTLDVEGILAEVDSQRALNRLTTKVNAEIAELWHREMLPRHFTRNAAARYGYSPRSAGTRKIRKRQRAQGVAVEADVALVKGGKTRDRATGLGVVRSWPTRGEVTFPVPFYIQSRRSKQRSINLVRELRQVSDEEADFIRAFVQRRTAELIAASRVRRKRRVAP